MTTCGGRISEDVVILLCNCHARLLVTFFPSPFLGGGDCFFWRSQVAQQDSERAKYVVDKARQEKVRR